MLPSVYKTNTKQGGVCSLAFSRVISCDCYCVVAHCTGWSAHGVFCLVRGCFESGVILKLRCQGWTGKNCLQAWMSMGLAHSKSPLHQQLLLKSHFRVVNIFAGKAFGHLLSSNFLKRNGHSDILGKDFLRAAISVSEARFSGGGCWHLKWSVLAALRC